MKKIIFRFCSISLLVVSGCAVGPLVTHETARTVGNSNHELIGGYGNAGAVLKWNYGVEDNLDMGLQVESLSVGVRLKYAFFNAKEKGWSLAGALGIGSSIGGNHYYGDIIGSYLNGSWEPYSSVRVVHVKTDPIEFRDEDTGDVDFTIDSTKYTYGQFMLGTRYWFTKHWLFSAEVSSLFSMSSLKIDNNVLVGGALGYRF